MQQDASLKNKKKNADDSAYFQSHVSSVLCVFTWVNYKYVLMFLTYIHGVPGLNLGQDSDFPD
jgi:hypothetical protein